MNSGMDRTLTQRQRIRFRAVEIARHSKMGFLTTGLMEARAI
jgi:hypothetical protein